MFKPMLSIDATSNLENLKYPKLASMKLDGVRFVIHPTLGMVSRSLKPIQNVRIRDKFYRILDIAIKNNVIFDGELYAHDLTFQEIISAVMTRDTTINIDKIKFHCFECCSDKLRETSFIRRLVTIDDLIGNEKDLVTVVKQIEVESKGQVEQLYRKALSDGYEGLILRDPNSPYKFGRSTLREEYMLKVKPFRTFDSHIIDVEQATVVDPLADKKVNELGHSVTSKKKDDRLLIEKASAFWVKHGSHKLKVSLAMTDEEKIEVWKNRLSYIGRMIEYKGMLVGAKDVPRHPVFVRFRDDRPKKKVLVENTSLDKWM